jgi:hypothetical protein
LSHRNPQKHRELAAWYRDYAERTAALWVSEGRLQTAADLVYCAALLAAGAQRRPAAVDVSRRNGIVWDAVIACEMLRVYKTQPEAYRRAAAHLALRPDEILMVACHNFDLDSARREGYRTAFMRRPTEWGPAGPPDPTPNPLCDLVVDGFAELASVLVR